MTRPVSDRRLILVGVFGILTLLMVGAMLRDGANPVPEGVTAALFALLGAALAIANGREDD